MKEKFWHVRMRLRQTQGEVRV